MNKSTNSEKIILYLILAVVLVFVLMRIPVLNRILLYAALLAILGLGIYLLVRWIMQMREKAQARAFGKTSEGRIQAKLENCRQLRARNQEEIEEIKKNIRELKLKLDSTTDISAQHKRDSDKLLRAFRSELNLRRSKTGFYDSCIRKLEGLLHNHQLARELETKKQRLRKLQENQYEELAQLEEIKSDLELDTYYLDTIEELSLKMLESDTVDDAEHLRLELETMTRELDEL